MCEERGPDRACQAQPPRSRHVDERELRGGVASETHDGPRAGIKGKMSRPRAEMQASRRRVLARRSTVTSSRTAGVGHERVAAVAARRRCTDSQGAQLVAARRASGVEERDRTDGGVRDDRGSTQAASILRGSPRVAIRLTTRPPATRRRAPRCPRSRAPRDHALRSRPQHAARRAARERRRRIRVGSRCWYGGAHGGPCATPRAPAKSASTACGERALVGDRRRDGPRALEQLAVARGRPRSGDREARLSRAEQCALAAELRSSSASSKPFVVRSSASSRAARRR